MSCGVTMVLERQRNFIQILLALFHSLYLEFERLAFKFSSYRFLIGIIYTKNKNIDTNNYDIYNTTIKMVKTD